ncbi:MAG: PAS domain S-box protein [Bryobacteraceae bacterium]
MEENSSSRRELLDILVSRLSEFVIVLADKKGNFTSWHPGVERHFGYSAEEFIGMNGEVLFTPGDRESGVPARELEQAVETGRASDTRWLVNKAGQPIFVEGVTIALRDPNQTPLAFGKVLRDVTEQKTADENLRALASALEQSTCIVCRFDGTIEHWTEGCGRLYGWTADQAVGKSAHELLGTTFPEPLESIQRQLLVSGTWKGELEQLCRDGRSVFVSAHWVLLSDQGEGQPAVIATHTDITGRLKVQRELERAHEDLTRMSLELERSNEELEEFARIASHDLSAPITSTRWLVDLLSSRHAGQLNADGEKLLKQISLGLERMGDLVQGVLAHAQVGTSAIGSSESTDAARSLATAIDNLRRDIETSEAVIRQGELPQLYIEPRALTQLFQNLLSNAMKYRRPETAPVIEVSSERQGTMWRLSVRDNGIGIEAEWFERIFQPLQRRQGTQIAGSGIGLATCKKIVMRAGGRIWVESQPGSGSTFYFTLPGPEVNG